MTKLIIIYIKILEYNSFDFILEHGNAIYINGYTFDSASNESVINGLVKLDDYVIVDWILGEEGAATSSFDEKEKTLVQNYIINGGRLFVSGSEIGYDLVEKGTLSDNIFYENINELSGLSKNHPLLSLSMMIILFSLAGIPPLAGFFAKFYVFMAVIEQSMYFLAIVGLLSTVVAAFYYLRIIKIMYFDKEKDKYDTDHSLWLKFSLTVSTILILLYFIFPSQLIEVVSRINII